MSNKISVGILGATGVVGQRFIQMLERHPWFEVAWLAASDRSEGKTYADAAKWRLKTAIPPNVASMKVSPATPDGAPKVIFAALDASIAVEMEPRFADAGCAVVSNSSALRMQSDVPLVIPEVNAGHIKLIDVQAWRKKSGGFVVTNPNCSAIGLVLALPPPQQRFGQETVMAVTRRAVSGARARPRPIAEQFGLVTTKPPDFLRQACTSISLMWPALTSGMTRGTSDCMRKALEFETTAHPASANRGSISTAIEASSAAKMTLGAPSGVAGETFMEATLGGIAVFRRHFAASAYVLPSERSEAASQATSNHG